jgi:ribosome-binding protein aMBF1 (putative translation factor)
MGWQGTTYPEGTTMSTQRRTASAVTALPRRYTQEDPERQVASEQERIHAKVARQIMELRLQAGLTQQELADKVQTTQSVISRLEGADYEGHSLSMLRRITEALGGRLDIAIHGDSSRQESLEAELASLADEWKRTRPNLSSSILKLVGHPAYQRIIGKGSAAIPFLLRRAQSDPDHWFWALTAITGEDPVPEEDRGDLIAMARAWAEWGKKRGYL